MVNTEQEDAFGDAATWKARSGGPRSGELLQGDRTFPLLAPRLPNLGLPSGRENTMGFFSKFHSSVRFETEVWFHNHFLANSPKETAEGMKHHLVCMDAKEVKQQKLQQRVL